MIIKKKHELKITFYLSKRKFLTHVDFEKKKKKKKKKNNELKLNCEKKNYLDSKDQVCFQKSYFQILSFQLL